MEEPCATLAPEPEHAPEPSPEPAPIVPGEPLVTLCGVALEQSERVVFFARPRHARQRVLYVLLGVLLAPLAVGVAFIAYGLMYERWHLRFVAVTDRRIILQRGTKAARWLRLADVSDVRAKRTRAPSGAIATPYPEARSAKTDPRHWAEAEAVVVIGKSGALSIDECVAPQLFGAALANVLWTDGYLERAAAVHHPS